MLSFASSMTWRGTLTRHAPGARQASAPHGGRGSVRHVLQGQAERRISGTGSLPYLPGLDGLRALAVIAVLLYHGELSWIPGGFLGVEVFFVISGYLITAVLLTQWRQSGRIDVKAFWLGRARRLLPALYLVLVATLAYAVVFLPGEVAGLRGDALAAAARPPRGARRRDGVGPPDGRPLPARGGSLADLLRDRHQGHG